jgi:hypothetical protein
MATLHTCPRCGSKQVRRSHRRGMIERFISKVLPIAPYRCAGCDHRFTGRTTGDVSARQTAA